MSRQLRGPAATEAVVAAARRLLAGIEGGVPSMEAIAADAGVTRATVYNHFSSRAALIDAVLTDAVRRHGMDRLVERSRGPSGNEALKVAITTCATFWESERTLLRCLFTLGADEPDVIQGLRQREAWRTQQFAEIVAAATPAETSSRLVGVIVALTSFATYDQLVTHTDDHATAEEAMQRAVAAHLGPVAEASS